MTFAKFSRGMALGALTCGLMLSTLNAQNGTNYHVFNNDSDVLYIGVGAGGSALAGDGIGMFMPGEDLRGNALTQTGDFGYRQNQFRLLMCVLTAGPSGTALRMPGISLVELTDNGAGKTGHDPVVFPTQPVDTGCAGFPLGTSGFVGFGAPAGSSANFLVYGLPSGVGSSAGLLIPNETFLPSAGGAVPTLLAFAGADLPIASTGFCWGVQFTWIPSSVTTTEDVTNGWWLWLQNSADNNQYWMGSNDELNLWKSHTVSSTGNITGPIPFFANYEYGFLHASPEPQTSVATAPTGVNAAGPYYLQTENITDGGGNPGLNLNGGFDLGGHGTVSLSGSNGVPDPTTGLGAQDPLGVGGLSPSGTPLFPSLGFWSFDGNDGDGSKRLTWVSVDLDDSLNAASPDAAGDIVVFGGTVRVPAPVPTTFPLWPQPITMNLWSLFTHETADCPSGCPDPGGFGTGAFGVAALQGGSTQLPTAPVNVCPALGGLGLAVTYGSSGLKGTPGAPIAGLTWSPAIAAASGSRTGFLIN